MHRKQTWLVHEALWNFVENNSTHRPRPLSIYRYFYNKKFGSSMHYVVCLWMDISPLILIKKQHICHLNMIQSMSEKVYLPRGGHYLNTTYQNGVVDSQPYLHMRVMHSVKFKYIFSQRSVWYAHQRELWWLAETRNWLAWFQIHQPTI